MGNSYAVTFRGKHAGKVQVRRQGLYYHFSCRCRLNGDGIYRLVVTCGSKRENLGILIPEDGDFALETKQPVKRIGEGTMDFLLIPKREERAQSFVPIAPEEPFAYISRLKHSFLCVRNGQTGVLINEMQE